MKSLSLLSLLAAGLFLSGCASDESTFTNVPPPSGSTPVASAAPASSGPQELPSTPPPEELPSTPPPAEQPAPRPAPVAQAKPKNTKAARKPAQPSAQPVVTADMSLTGKVVTYNAVGKFAVLSFPVGKMAQLNQNMSVYHNGTKTGDVHITGPQRDNNIVADVVSGTIQPGDEVRDQ